MALDRIEVPIKDVTPARLLKLVGSHDVVEVGGWSLIQDDAGIWMTNPYGIDVGLVEPSEEQCCYVIDSIKKSASLEREWGHL